MLLCLLPMAAFADEIAPLDLSAGTPRTGSPSVPAVPVDAYGYSVLLYTINISSVSTEWTYLDSENVPHVLPMGDEFEPETVYTAHTTLHVLPGNEFHDPPTITFDGEPAVLESWNPSNPYEVTVSRTYPKTDPLLPVEKVAVEALEPLFGDNPDPTVTCDYGEPYSIESAGWYDSADVLQTTSDTYKAGETYRLTVRLRADGFAKFPEDLAADKCVINPDYFGAGKTAAAVRVMTEKIAEVDFTWTVPDPIDTVELKANEQGYGEAPMLYSWAEDGVGYMVKNTEWYDDTEGRYLDGSDTLTKGHDYHLEIEVHPTKGNSFTGAINATFNGTSALYIGYLPGYIIVHTSAPVKDPEKIAAVEATYSGEVAPDVEASESAEVPTGVKYDIVSVVWYDADDNDIYAFKFEKGKTYTVKITLEADSGFVFADDATFKLNGADAIHTWDGSRRVILEKTYNVEEPKWAISFDGNGGSGTMAAAAVKKGDKYTLPACGFTAPEGKVFDKWNLGAPGDAVEITADTAIQAIWKDKPAESWTIKFDAGGGSGTMADASVKKGDKYKLPACSFTAPTGKEFDKWDAGKVGDEINVTADLTVKAVWKDKTEKKENPFEDVKETDYFYDAVLWAYYAKPQVTNGIDTTHFGPTSTVTRGQAVTFLWRAMGCPEPTTKTNPFVDVPETEYYYKPILWAVEKGITKGTDDTHFTPNQTCSTAHILTFLYRTLGIGTDGWYQVAEAWAKGAGLLDGLTLKVEPGVDCPRSDVVLFLYRQLGK